MELTKGIKRTAFAFRGYNVENLGRTAELLSVPAYRGILESYLRRASKACSQILATDVDLVARVEAQRETTLEDYGEAIALIVSVEQAQLQILRDVHGVDYKAAGLTFGFSLGEISALVAGGTYEMEHALRIPLAMSKAGVELARDVTLGILFSRREELSLDKVQQILLTINAQGDGVIGISTHLGPNSVLVMGTGTTIDALRGRLKEIAPRGVHLRCNEHRWPPLHTPIVWEKDITTRAARMLHTLPGGFQAPEPQVLSLVTGQISYDDFNARDHMIRWTDQTQRLWDAVYEILACNMRSIVHVGPAPNIIPATFDRLASNVEAQTRGSRRMHMLSAVINRPWLSNILPRRAALLRAPNLQQIVLEDWLLDHAPSRSGTVPTLSQVATD